MNLISRRALLAGSSALLLSTTRPFGQAEILSLEWLGTQLASGAVSYVGGMALSSVLGGYDFSDVRDWIRAAIAEIEQIIDKKMDETAIAELAAEVRSIGRNLTEYAALDVSNRAANRHLIDNANTRTTYILERASDFQQAFDVSVAAMALRIMVLKASYDLDKDAGRVTVARSAFDDFMKKMSDDYMYLSFGLNPANRIELRWHGCWVGDQLRGRVFLDGKPYIPWHNLDVAKAVIQNDVGPKALALYRSFSTAGSDSLLSISRAISSLFEYVGHDYQSPVPHTGFMDMSADYTVTQLTNCDEVL